MSNELRNGGYIDGANHAIRIMFSCCPQSGFDLRVDCEIECFSNVLVFCF
jgi:hypothetical protein